ncbi:MAG: hypothetical protein ABII21_00175 [bacterium]
MTGCIDDSKHRYMARSFWVSTLRAKLENESSSLTRHTGFITTKVVAEQNIDGERTETSFLGETGPHIEHEYKFVFSVWTESNHKKFQHSSTKRSNLMITKISKLFVFVMVAVLIASCATAQATPSSISPAAGTATAIVQAAADEQLIRDAEAKATQMAGGAIPTVANVVNPTPIVANPTAQTTAAQPTTANDRISRLVELDAIYRAQGWQTWLKAAGFSCDANVEARQPEEETVVFNGKTRVVVSGIQVRGNCGVPYPAAVTTDRPGEVTTTTKSRTYQPDLKNPSVLYTDVTLHGQGTLWVDVTNWSQMDPTE